METYYSKRRKFRIKKCTNRDGLVTFRIEYRYLNLFSSIFSYWYKTGFFSNNYEIAKSSISDYIKSDENDYRKEIIKTEIL